MGEGKRVSLLPLYVVFAVIACASLQLCASDSIFYESFDDDFEGRWIVSEKEDYKG